MFHSKGKILLWLAALVTLLSLGLASKPLGLNARSISSEQTGGLMLNNEVGGTIVIEKQTDPAGGTDFSFLEDFGIPFSLDDGVTLTFPNVPVATYTITETLPIGWELTSVDCETDDTSDTSSWSGNTLTIDLDAGETITCTFNNAALGTIVLQKQTNPPGGTGFAFTDDFDLGIPEFSLNDGATLTIPYVPAGEYTVTEADPVPSGFDLIDVDCEDPDGGSSVDLKARTATIELDAGETVTCTFTNGQRDIIPVGGYAVSVNRLTLLAPWLGLVALASLAALTVALVRRRRG